MSRMNRFVEELNRRNVFRAGAAYIVISWLLAQVAELLLDTFAAPDWVMQIIVLALAIGLPIALVLSWIYEITVEGIVRTSDVVPGLSITEVTGRRIDFIIIGILAVAVIIFTIDKFVWRDSAAIGTQDIVSVAVLPFTFDRDEIAPFYAQISTDVSKQLGRRPDVRLASSDAIRALPSGMEPARIATRLGVNFLVSGFIDLVENRLSLSVSIFDASHDAKVHERAFAVDDLPQIDRVIAEEVLGVLGTDRIATKRRNVDSQAYQLYLQAQQAYEAPRDEDDQVYSLLEKALEIEPQFAFAHALMCRYFVREYRRKDSLYAFEEAERRCFRAWTLDGESPEVLYAMASLYLHSGQEEKAMESFRSVLDLNPNHYDARLGVIESVRRSEPDLAEAEYKRLIREHPGSPGAYVSFQQHLFFEGRYDEAVEFAEIAYQLEPVPAYAGNLSSDLVLAGYFERAQELLESEVASGNTDPTIVGNLATSKFFLGDYAGAAALYRDALDTQPDSTMANRNYGDAIYHLEGRDSAKQIYENVVELGLQHLAINPDSYGLLFDLAVAYGSVGDKEQFYRFMKKALERYPDDAQSHYSIAVGASRLGDMEAAASHAKKAYELGFPIALLTADPDIKASGAKFE